MKEIQVWGRQRGESTGTAESDYCSDSLQWSPVLQGVLSKPLVQPYAPGGPLQASSDAVNSWGPLQGQVLLRRSCWHRVSPAQVCWGVAAAATWCSAAPPAARWATSAPFCTGAWRALCYGPCNSPAGRSVTATGKQRGTSGDQPGAHHPSTALLRTSPAGFLCTYI